MNGLQQVASQIVDFVGVDSSIQIDLDLLELTRQLNEIIETVEASKSVSSNNNKAQLARKVTVSKSHNLIDNVTEDLRKQKSPNEELTGLRSHLLNLGVIENDLQNQKNSDTMNSDENSSIVNTLSSLQNLFKETITKYNKLSSQLVNDSDNEAIFKIWSDYLFHVESFLRSSIPSDYKALQEQLHLCKIHQSLISNQRNALIHKISVDKSMIKDIDKLKDKHADILSLLLERQREIESRLDTWEKYRKQQFDLLESLDDVEREKSLLHLKQIYLKSIPKLKDQIKDILTKLSDAESKISSLKNSQGNLLNFIDDVTSSSMRLEYTSIQQRAANIRASLETWLDFLKRIEQLNNNYELHVKSIQENYQRQLNFLGNVKNETATNFSNSKQQLEILKEKQKALSEIKSDLEQLNSLKDEMKDYISSYDLKMMRQSIWILWQQYSDLNHEYSLLINQIEERICLQTEFLIRYENLMFWLNETEGRLMEASVQKHYQEDDPYMRLYANNILEDFALKEYDRKWIQSVGNELLLFYTTERNYDSPEKIDIECKLANLNSKWSNVKALYDSRLRKINQIKATYYNLEARIAEIRTWLFETEKELMKPFIFEEPTKAAYEDQLKDYEKVQRSVENNSANVAEILNLSEMVLSELRTLDMEMSVKNLNLAINSIEYRWKRLCESLVKRKRSLITLWNNLEEMNTTTNIHAPWLIECDELCNEIEESSKNLMSKEKSRIWLIKLNEYLEKIAMHSQTLHILEKLYNTVLTANVDVNNIKNITSETRRILIIWKTITIRISTLKTLLQNYFEQFESFENLHENLILKLTQIDIDITQIKHLKTYEGTDEELDKLDAIKRNYDDCAKLIEAAEILRISLMENSSEEERLRLKTLSDEYLNLFNNIKINYEEMQKQYGEQMTRQVVEEVDVAVQVNTLQEQASVSPKDAYKYEIQTAINEFKVKLKSVIKPLILASSPSTKNAYK